MARPLRSNSNPSKHFKLTGQPNVSRSSSLHLSDRKDLHIPIPPSLLLSPHLNGPRSIFQQASHSRTPSEEDERWLQDMVPLASGEHGTDAPEASSCSSRSSDSGQLQRRNTLDSALKKAAPLSTPIIRRTSHSAASKPSAASSRSTTTSSSAGYFPHTPLS